MKILIEIVLILLFCFSCSSTKPESEISDTSEAKEDIKEDDIIREDHIQ